MTKTFVNPQFHALLERHGFLAFAHLWALDVGWFEAPNERRGGWSGVSKCAWETADGQVVHVFLKRQENHNAKTWRHPFKGVPTFAREMDNILRYQQYQIPTLTPVYFAQRRDQGQRQAILVTESLEGYRSLEAWIAQWQNTQWPSRRDREVLLTVLAKVLRNLHQHLLVHNCMYPKHLFVRWETGESPIVRIIDLEKTRRKHNAQVAMFRDLSTLYRHLGVLRIKDQLSFLRHYLQIRKMTPKAKQIWREIDQRVKDKVKT